MAAIFVSAVSESVAIIMKVQKRVEKKESEPRYSGVPQNVFVNAPYDMDSLQRPKSAIFIWPAEYREGSRLKSSRLGIISNYLYSGQVNINICMIERKCNSARK